MKRQLVLIRHGESLWNAKGIWTGRTDIGLSERGKEEARRAAEVIRHIPFDAAYTSVLRRASETLDIIIATCGWTNLPVYKSAALNERDYGVYTGKNKSDVKRELGDEIFLLIRRAWDYPIAQGESLKQVYSRVVPYYDAEIAPRIMRGENVLVVAHGNSLRALVKKLDNVSDADISAIELATGEALIYSLDRNGSVIRKDIRK